MTTFLRQSTAVEVPVGPFVDETDGRTIESALTLTQPDIRLKKGGAAWAQKSAAQTLSHEENGWYEVSLSTTDTDTLGALMLAINEAGALPVWREFMVVTQQVWDSLFSTDLLQVDVAQFGNAAGTFASGRPEVNTTLIEGSDATNQIRDAVVDDATRIDASALNVLTSHDPGATLASGTAVSTIDSKVDTIVAAVDTEVAAIKAKTDNLPASPASQTSMDSQLAAIQADVDTIVTTTAALPSANAIADATLDRADGIETGWTLSDTIKVIAAATAGKSSGHGTGTVTYRSITDDADRIVADVDAGNRTSVTLDAS